MGLAGFQTNAEDIHCPLRSFDLSLMSQSNTLTLLAPGSLYISQKVWFVLVNVPRVNVPK